MKAIIAVSMIFILMVAVWIMYRMSRILQHTPVHTDVHHFNIHLVTFAYGGPAYVKTQEMLDQTATFSGIYKSHKFGLNDFLQSQIYIDNERVIHNTFREKGHHWKDRFLWTWKPFVILETMKRVRYGDYVLYHDSSRHHREGFTEPNGTKKLVNYLRKNDVLDSVPTVRLQAMSKNMDYKTDTQLQNIVSAIGITVNDTVDMPMVQASFQIWRKNNNSMRLLEEFQRHMLNRELMLAVQFEDQSILGFMSKKYHLPTLYIPYPDDGKGGDAVKHINVFTKMARMGGVMILYQDDPYPQCTCKYNNTHIFMQN